METEATAVPETGVPGVEHGAESAAEPDVENAELAALKALADERYAELQYARAENENVRKRAAKNAEDRLASSRRSLIAKFLPVLDNLKRAVSYGENADLRGGVQATLKAFEQLLASEGLVPVETIGKQFDPRNAEAITTRETTEHEDGIVLDELQQGYLLGEDLVRPAMVIVAAHIEEPAPITPGDEATTQSE